MLVLIVFNTRTEANSCEIRACNFNLSGSLSCLNAGTISGSDYGSNVRFSVFEESKPNGLGPNFCCICDINLVTAGRDSFSDAVSLSFESKCADDAVQAFTERFRIQAHANPKMIRHFKEATRNR